jgi:hypothetical protein
MDEQQTCGKGLAQNSALPAKLGELISAVGGILEAHIPSLDLTDQRSQREREVYQYLVDEHRQVGVLLESIARQMAEYRDLPMGQHVEKELASPVAVRSFQRFVLLEQELLTMLQQRLEQDNQMLTAMQGQLASGLRRSQ